MLLHVRHRTRYRYDRPARFVVQSHRLTPVTTASQRVLDWEVRADGAVFGARLVDGAGDVVTTMTHAGPVEAIEIVVEGRVETADTAGVLRGQHEAVSPLVYLAASPATAPGAAVLALRDRALAGGEGAGALERAHRLAAAVAEAVAYRPGATDAGTTAAEALERGEGVCQDHAQVMIAAARAAGLPARYVAGYLFGGEDGAPYEASHAWAEVHVEGLGWVGFDPANRCCPDARYVRVGSGRDAREAAPIRGVAGGQAAETLDVEVVVAEGGQSQSQSQS